MRLRAPEIEIPEDQPFQYDVLNRAQAAESLLALIKGTEDSLVICINAPWGQGKSTFLRMFRQTCNNNKIQSILLNAWENDFSTDAFVTLLGDLEIGLEGIVANQTERTAIENKFSQAKDLGKRIFKAAMPVAIRIATSGLVNLDDVAEQSLSDFTGKLAEDKLKQYEEARKSVAGFRSKLAEVADLVSASGGSDTRNPLVIFVDELDRCKPSFAVSYLENIKHFFAVDNVIFVIALDREQLSHSIRSMYGAGMDVDGYLRRFIDVDLNLPSPNTEDFLASMMLKFRLNDFFKSRLSGVNRYDEAQTASTLNLLSKALGLSLRDIERACTSLSLAASSTPSNYYIYPLLLVTMIAFKIKHPSIYLEFVSGRSNHVDMLKILESSNSGRELLESNYGISIEAHLISCHAGRHMDRELSEQYSQKAATEPEGSPRRIRLERISSILADWNFRESFGQLGYLTQKIDLITPPGRN